MSAPRCLFLAAGVLGVLAFGVDGHAPPTREDKARTDHFGDPLPEHALARLGTVRFRHANGVAGLLFTRDGKSLLSGGGDKPVRLWDRETGKEVGRIPGTAGAWSIALSPDGATLAEGTATGAVRLWDLKTARLLRRLPGEKGPAQPLAFAGNGKLFAVADRDGVIRVWDLPAEGRKSRVRLRGHQGNVHVLAFTPDGKTLVSAGVDRTVRIWDVDKGSERKQVRGQRTFQQVLALSPDGALLVCGASPDVPRGPIRPGQPVKELPPTIQVLDVASGESLRPFPITSSWITSLAFAPDGKLLAVAAQGSPPSLWRVSTRKQVRPLAIDNSDRWHALTFSPDGKLLACVDTRTIRLWDVATGKETRASGEYAPGGSVNGVFFLDGGKTILTGGTTQPAMLWEAATGKLLRRFGDPRRGAIALALSADGKILATAGMLGQLLLWDVDKGKQLRWQAIFGVRRSPPLSFFGTARGKANERRKKKESGGDRRTPKIGRQGRNA